MTNRETPEDILVKSPAFSGTLPGFRLISSTTPDLPQPSRDSVYLVVPAKKTS